MGILGTLGERSWTIADRTSPGERGTVEAVETKGGARAPLVTVIMSVYPAGEQLSDALRSVLEQTHRNLEVIVVDDGNDGAGLAPIREIRDERLTVLRQDHAGKAAALNRALQVTRGDFYAIQDADDISDPRRIEVQVQAMAARPELACVFCGFDLILDGEHVAPLYPQKSVEECRETIDSFRMPGHDPTAMFRVSMVAGIRYEESLAIGQGFDYVLRVGERFPMMTVGECLYSYRVHQSSHSRRDPLRRDELVRAILVRACARRGLSEANWPLALRRPPEAPDAYRDPDNNLAAHFIESALHLKAQGRIRQAFRTALACARLRPLDPRYLRPLAFLLMPARLLGWLRRRRSARR